MPTTTPIKMNVNEAKAKFSSLLAGVERTGQPVTILRYGHPVARLVPIEPVREIRPLPGYGRKIAIKGDLFADDSDLWENAR